MNSTNLFSVRLNELLNNRKPKKIKKNELASALYVTPQTVSRWCNGVIIPDRGTIELITKKINEMYGHSPNAPERYRSEYLAGEDKIPTYDFLSPIIMDYINNRKKENDLVSKLLPLATSILEHSGYNKNQVKNYEHFSRFVYEYLKIAVASYMDYINQPMSK